MKDFAKRLLKGDVVLLSVIVFLMLISLLVIFSSTGRLAYNEQGGDTWHYFFKQLGLCISGLVVMWGMRFFPWRWLYDNVWALLVGAAALVALAAFGGKDINGAGRWLEIPIIGITFQPSEFAKIAVVLFSAKLLSDFQEPEGCSSEVLKYFWTPLMVMGLIFLDNFSTSALVGVVCLVMCWIGRVRSLLLLKWLGIGISGLVLLLILGIAFPKIQEMGRIGTIIVRLVTWVDKDRETEKGRNSTYQSDQAHIAVAKGGMTGCGPGNSVQRNFLPHPYSDFIYAIIIEEYGLVGGIFIFLLYSIILFRVGVIAHKTLKIEHLNPRGGPELFPALVVIGLGFSIVLQAMFHMGVNVGALPVTGQTLPLVSMGGSSVWFVLAALGIIFDIAYDFSPDGIAEKTEKANVESRRNQYQQSRCCRRNMNKEDTRDEVFEEETFSDVEYLQTRNTSDSKIDTENLDVVGELGLPDLEKQLEKDGRKVLEKLNERGRRSRL